MTWAVPALLPVWRLSMTARGRVAYDPSGSAEIHYAEGLPPADLEVLVAGEVGRWGELNLRRRPGDEALVTDEGEYAAMVVFDGERHGRPVVVAVGVVLGDEPAAVLVSIAEAPGLVDTTRSLLLKDVQFRGHRRRRFRHSAPQKWTVERIGFDTHYVLADRAQITVFPAMPGDPPRDPRSAQELVEAPTLREVHGLPVTGVMWQTELQDLRRTVALLADRAFTYSLRLDGRPDDRQAEEAFLALIESIEALPAPQGGRTNESHVANHWLD
jgi:hypothetical protein